jgi:hypothetical protein
LDLSPRTFCICLRSACSISSSTPLKYIVN